MRFVSQNSRSIRTFDEHAPIASSYSNSSGHVESDLSNATSKQGSNPKIRIQVRVSQKPSVENAPVSEPESPVHKPKSLASDLKKQKEKQKPTLQDFNSYIESNIGSYNHITSFSDLPLEFGYNQHISIDNELRERLRSILWKFNAPIKYAFAYGSGVFSQGKPVDASQRQVDLIFGVSYTEHWHSLNMRQNPHHYSALRYLGSGAISTIQDKFGAGVYFNPYVEIDGIKIKYGVVNMDTMLTDLHKWSSLFVAGRLQKPVKILRDEPRARFVNQTNLISALRTALLLLPETFSELDLYKTIAGNSYRGDPRMMLGENPNKVNNIVNNQFLNFRNLYSPLLDVLPNVNMAHSSAFKLENTEIPVASMKQDMDPVTRGNMVHRLPLDFRQNLYVRYQSKLESSNLDESEFGNNLHGTLFDQQIAADPNLSDNVSKAIKSTVFGPSLGESIKGVFTAGFGRSLRYAFDKLQKNNL